MSFLMDYAQEKMKNIDRRTFMKHIAYIGLASFSGMILPGKNLWAKGKQQYGQGVRELNGAVSINGRPAVIGALVNPGDTIITGKESQVIFVLKDDAFLIRAESTLIVPEAPDSTVKENIVQVINLLRGKALMVFGKKEINIRTPTAVIGVRGTGLYVEAEPEFTYVCICYGLVTVRPSDTIEGEETLKSRHHEQARYIYQPGAVHRLEKAPMLNHADEELIKLETFVGRKPAFLNDDYKPETGGGY